MWNKKKSSDSLTKAAPTECRQPGELCENVEKKLIKLSLSCCVVCSWKALLRAGCIPRVTNSLRVRSLSKNLDSNRKAINFWMAPSVGGAVEPGRGIMRDEDMEITRRAHKSNSWCCTFTHSQEADGCRSLIRSQRANGALLNYYSNEACSRAHAVAAAPPPRRHPFWCAESH